jgi:GGDEF domain-containing protein
MVVESELDERMARKAPIALIRLDVARLWAFNRAYGIANGDELIRHVGRLIGDASARCGGPDDLVAHLGEDDFVVLTTPEAAEGICRFATAAFDELLPTLYTPEHVRQGYVDVEHPWGKREQARLCALAAAAQTNRSRRLPGYARLMETLEAMLRTARTRACSAYLIDRAG